MPLASSGILSNHKSTAISSCSGGTPTQAFQIEAAVSMASVKWPREGDCQTSLKGRHLSELPKHLPPRNFCRNRKQLPELQGAQEAERPSMSALLKVRPNMALWRHLQLSNSPCREHHSCQRQPTSLADLGLALFCGQSTNHSGVGWQLSWPPSETGQRWLKWSSQQAPTGQQDGGQPLCLSGWEVQWE